MRRLLFLIDESDPQLRRVLSKDAVEFVTWREWTERHAVETAFVAYNIIHQDGRVPESLESRISERVLDANRQGRLGIVLDVSREATPIRRGAWAAWYDLFARIGLSTHLVFHVSQNVRTPGEHASYCLENGVERPICATRYHWFLKRLIDDHCSPAEQPRRVTETVPPGDPRPGEEERLALCFMYKARPNRIRLALSLLKHDLWDRSLVSFGGLDPAVWQTHLRINPNDALERLRAHADTSGLDAYLPALMAKGRVLIDTDDPIEVDPGNTRAADMIYDLAASAYRRTRFSIVSETEMMNTMHRFTEKSVKPLANRHPMIVFGNPQTLRLLRELGFATFSGLIDESYDEIMTPNERFDAAFEEVRRLAAMTPAEWTRASRRIDDVLDYNAETFFTRLPETFERIVEKPFLRDLAARAHTAETACAAP